MRNINELPECPVATTISLVGNKWKLLIIRNLTRRTWRFNELQKSLNGISQKVLTECHIMQFIQTFLKWYHIS